MKLSELVNLLTLCQTSSSFVDVEITGIRMNSRDVRPGDLFVCIRGIPGFQEDRHSFVSAAKAAGAAALVVERDVITDLPCVKVPDARYALAVFATHFYGYPSSSMRVIGVTGTNGKTTTTFMIERILSHAGHRTGLMGNIGILIGGVKTETDINTQEPNLLQYHLGQMRDTGHRYCVMEVSSQGLHMGRVMGCDYSTAVFTNLTQDHLDYHLNMDAYLQAKALLFSRLGNSFSMHPDRRKFAVLNADDPASQLLQKSTTAQVLTYGIESRADVSARDIRLTPEGARFRAVTFAGSADIELCLPGLFNVYNALAAITTALAEGIDLCTIKAALLTLTAVPGRMERIEEGQDFTVLVDFAHSPDGLEKALATVRQLTHGKLITLFGCGGNRDVTKRPIMGAISARYSDITIVTSDNPRREDPEAILRDVAEGLESDAHYYELIADRGKAVKRAIELAETGDLVLLAGKGHETYQVLAEGPVHFDDREEARRVLRERLRTKE